MIDFVRDTLKINKKSTTFYPSIYILLMVEWYIIIDDLHIRRKMIFMKHLISS